MSRRIVGTLTAPDGTPLGSTTVSITATRNDVPGILKGARFEFTTDGSGDYDETLENGIFRVAVMRNDADIGIGNIEVTSGDDTTITALLITYAGTSGPMESALQQLLDDAVNAAAAAEDSADEAQLAQQGAEDARDTLLAQKGQANGLAELDGAGLVPSSQLPSYVDDVIEVADEASLPATGEQGKIYVTLDDNHQHRWTGSVYVDITESNSLTAADVKSLYESNADTNAFTDAEESKLAGIEAGATADQSPAEIKSDYESNANTNAFTDSEKSKLSGVESGATADQNASEVPYDNTDSGLSATDVKGALDETTSHIGAHLNDTNDAHAASAIGYDNSVSGLAADDAQAAIDEVVAGLGTAASRDAIGAGDLYSRGGILGTASQSGGVPTGAIIERGSNANGSFTKYADGTMICMKSSFSSASNASATWTYPSEFAGGADVVVTATAISGSARIVTQASRSNASVDIHTYDASGSDTPSPVCDLVAIGYWY